MTAPSHVLFTLALVRPLLAALERNATAEQRFVALIESMTPQAQLTLREAATAILDVERFLEADPLLQEPALRLLELRAATAVVQLVALEFPAELAAEATANLFPAHPDVLLAERLSPFSAELAGTAWRFLLDYLALAAQQPIPASVVVQELARDQSQLQHPGLELTLRLQLRLWLGLLPLLDTPFVLAADRAAQLASLSYAAASTLRDLLALEPSYSLELKHRLPPATLARLALRELRDDAALAHDLRKVRDELNRGRSVE